MRPPRRSPDRLVTIVDGLVRTGAEPGCFHEALVAADVHGRIRIANVAAEMLVGCKPGGLLGRSFFHCFRPWWDGRAAHREPTWKVLREDGTHLLVLGHRARVQDGGRRLASVTVFSPRVEAESRTPRGVWRAYWESEERFRRLVEASPEGILLERGGRIAYANPMAAHLFGAESAAGLVGRRLRDHLPPEDAALLERQIARSRATGEPVALYETRLCRDGGDRITVEATISPIIRLGEEAILLVLRDVSSRQRALAEAAARKAELRKATEVAHLKDHFLSTLSHEMKTPLSLIIGYAELLEDKYPHEPLLAGIRDGAQRLGCHINNMLDYSALLSDSLPLYRTEVVVPELVTTVADEARADFGAEVALSVRCRPGVPAIEADPRRVAQILNVLLENARKFTPLGGEVGVDVRPEGRGVRIDVWDTGIGIDPAEQPRIWEAFTQLDMGDAVRKGGLGLGLTIARRLAEMHGGHLEVKSEPGDGACFSLYLPPGPVD